VAQEPTFADHLAHQAEYPSAGFFMPALHCLRSASMTQAWT
jgi:hypothetical protein